MAWGRLDDGFHDHPKVGGLTLAAVGVWTLCFSWCNRQLGNAGHPAGFIPTHQPRRFGATAKHIRELVDAGLWDVVDGGWVMHDYVDFLPPSHRPETASELSQKRSEAGRRGAAARWGTDGKTHGNLPSQSHTGATASMANVDAIAMPPYPYPNPKGGGLPANVRPDPWCDLHPGGTDQPCRNCRDARQHAETWQPPTPTPPTIAELRARGVLPPRPQETA